MVTASGTQSPVINILRRKWLWGCVILIGALVAWHFLHKSSARGFGDFPGFGGGRMGRNAPAVGVATAEKKDIPVVLNALGTVTATATATVRPQVSGVLQQVNFHEGQLVKAGQVLAVIDPRPFELALMQASGQRQRDEAQLDNARLILKRDQELLAQDSIARQDVEAQQALVKQLEGTVMADHAQEGTAKLNLGYTKVVAPVSGRVGLRVQDIGNLVTANDAAGIAVITQIAPIDVQFAIPQVQVGDLQAELGGLDMGKPAPLKVDVLDRDRSQLLATGQFLALDNQVDVQTGTVRAKARFANDKATLFPNQFVNVRLVVRVLKEAVVIPVSALRHSSKGDFVFVLDEASKTVSQRDVVAGQMEQDEVVITQGLKVGEKVITEGADRLKEGATVNLPGTAPAPAAGDKKEWQARREEWKKHGGSVAGGEHKRKRPADGAPQE